MKTINRSTALALSLGLSLGLASLSASAQQTSPESEALVCDADGDGFVGVDEATACAEQEFGGMAADEDYLTEEQFGTMYRGTGEPGATFAEVDADGDGQISAEEWVSWRERAFTEATQGSGARMPTSDYERWQGGDIGAERPAQRSP